jgi:NADH dehydrogenase
VRTLTFHPDRAHPLQDDVESAPYRFDDPVALARSLAGVRTLYNTFWVRFDHGSASFASAIERSRMLFGAAGEAGVRRVVHLSITNPSIGSPLPYFKGKALVEDALARSGVPHSIVRPTWTFGGSRDILTNNIAWILRRMPLFAIPGDGTYPVQPVHVDDLARICVDAAELERDATLDAAGPETMPFHDLVARVRRAVGSRSPIIHVPPRVMAASARALGALVRDVVLTPDEIRGLMEGLLVSREPPLGATAFSGWLDERRASIGRSYANELHRHFTSAAGA